MDVPSNITIGGWFIQVIFDKYLSSKLQEWAADCGIGDDLDKLRIAMLRIQSVLSCAEKTRSEGILGWMKELRDVSYDAEDLLDELEYLRLQQQLDAKSSSLVSAFLASNLETARDVTTRAGGFFSSSIFNFKEGNREAGASFIDRLSNSRPLGTPEMAWDRVTKARIRTVIERLNHVGSCVNETITLLKLDHYNGVNERTRKGASSSLISTRVFGREEEAKELIDRLLKFDDEQVSVLPVVGTGGVGKTTLAQLVYNDPKIVEHFDLKMWVYVSDSFDDTELMGEILECASDDSQEYGNIMNFNRLQLAIKRKLMWKRFLLVLDDVWSQESRSRLTEMERWNKLLAPLKAGKSGSKILVTTRSRTVSEMLSTVSSINLKGLKDQDCWSLIKESTCCDVNHDEQLKLEKIGNIISQKLKGLPLAAKAVARLLKDKLDTKDWNVVFERNDIWDDMIPILKPSYHNLPAHLQRCFTYCSMFPRGWKFESDDLIYLWMAQGYIQPQNKNIRMEDSGQGYVDDLLNRSIFEVHKKGFITYYVVDSALHDLAQYVSRDECIRVEGDEPLNLPPSIRHLSIKTGQVGRIKDVDQFHNLRTLILTCSEIQSHLHNAILEDALNELKHIRALDLSHCKMANFPATICQCIHLRYLNLSSTSIQLLPESLCKLYHLQVLNLTGCRLLNLPSGMTKLINLRHLTASDELVSDIEEIGRLTSLQRLYVFRVRSKEGYKIRELKYMNELEGSLQIRNLENVESKEEASEAILNSKDRLHILKFQWQSSQTNQLVDAEVLEGLQPHPNLKRLEIIGCNGATYPSWLATNWLTNLEVVYVRDSRCWECLPPLSQLPSLKILWVQGLHAVKRIGSELFGAGDKEFKWLKELVLDDMPELEQCLQDSQLFPRLQNIVIKDCNKLRTLPPLPPSLTELTVLNLGFWIPYYDDARMSQVASVVSSLCIYNCPVLTASFCESLEEENFSSLQTISIGNTSLLIELIERKGLANLKNLDIIKCPEITFFTIEQERKFEYLTALQSLSFSGCVNLQSLPQLQGLCSLEKLIVSDCPLIQSLPKKGLPSSLKVLEIESCHPLLKEWCRKRDGNSWESIKCIPRIEIDGEVIYEYPSGN